MMKDCDCEIRVTSTRYLVEPWVLTGDEPDQYSFHGRVLSVQSAQADDIMRRVRRQDMLDEFNAATGDYPLVVEQA